MKMINNMTASGLRWLWIALVVIVLDRYTKIWALTHLTFHEPLAVLPIFNLTLAYNTGAAFSFLDSMSGWQNIFLCSLAFIVTAFVLYWLATLSYRARWMSIALCFIIAGALGNAWDRIHYGYVIDFLSFHWASWYFAIFNLADTAICIGAFMLLWNWFTQSK